MRKCISSFATADGKVIAAGEFVEDNDPVIKGHEVFFAGVSDPVQAPKVEAREEGDTMPDNVNDNAEPTVPPVVDERAELRKAEEAAEEAEANRKKNNDDDADGNRRVVADVEEATAEPGGRRNTARSSDRGKSDK